MYPISSDSPDIHRTTNSQLSQFIIGYSIFAQLKEWEIVPSLLLGHSLGEYTAMASADSIDAEEMLRVLKHRGDLFSRTDPAKMLGIKGNIHQLRMLLPEDVEITAYLNDSFHCVVGPAKSIANLKDMLHTNFINFRELATEFGFHSYMLDDILSEYLILIQDFHFQAPSIPLLSNVDGELVRSITPQYLSNQMRAPVRLDKCLANVMEMKKKMVVQIGPRGILENLLSQSDVKVVNTVADKKKAPAANYSLFNVLSDMWRNGYEIDFRKVFTVSPWDPEVPTYQFERIKCWRSPVEETNHSEIRQMVWKQVSQARTRDNAVFVISNEKNTNVDHQFELQEAVQCDQCAVHVSQTVSRAGIDVCIYAPAINSDANVQKKYLYLYYFVKCLCEHLNSGVTLVLVSYSGDSVDWIGIGPLRERILRTGQDMSFFVQTTSTNYKEIANNILSAKSDSNILKYIRPSEILSLSYAATEKLEKVNLGGNILILGGGAIAKNIIKWISDSSVKRISIWSRSAATNQDFLSLKGDISKHKELSINLLNVDVSDINTVRTAFGAEKDHFTSILFSAGVQPKNSMQKHFEQCMEVLQPKVTGLSNLLSVMEAAEIPTDNLILFSSLSSVLSINGTHEYASASLFLDSVALKGHPNIKRILSIQWPAWRDVGMYAQNKTSLLEDGSISLREARKYFLEALNYEGCVSICKENPFTLRKRIVAHQIGCKQRNPEEPVPLSKEDILKDIWRKLLCVKTVTDETDFFEAGGNSLSVLQMCWQIKQSLSLDIRTDSVFTHSKFGKFKTEGLTLGNRIEIFRIDKKEKLPLSYSQENMYLLHQLQPEADYNIVFALNFNRQVNQKAIRYAILRMVTVQIGLRTVFLNDVDGLRQEARSSTEHYFTISSGRSIEIRDPLEMRKIPFCISHCCQAIELCQTDESLKIVFAQNHIITDGWSMSVLAENMSTFYEEYTTQCIKPQRLPLNIPDFANWQRTDLNLVKNIESEAARLRPITEVPTRIAYDRHINSESENQFYFRTESKMIPVKLLEKIRKLSQKFNTTVYIVMISAFAILLRNWKNEVECNRVTIGSPVSGRTVKEMTSVIGYFLNNIVISLDVAPEERVDDVVPRMIRHVKEVRDNEHVPFHKIVQSIRQPRTGHHPIFDIYFNFRETLDFPRVKLGESSCEVEQLSTNTIFDLSWTIDDTPEGHRLLVDYNGRYSSSIISNMMENYFRILCNNTSIPRTIPVNTTDYPHSTIQFIISDQKSLTPLCDAYNNKIVYSYRALFRRVKILALHLQRIHWRNKGRPIMSDDCCFVDNNMDDALLICLAVTLSGAAYVPIEERITETQWMQRSEDNEFFKATPFDANFCDITKRFFNLSAGCDILYVIHTSGSTGTPKSVPISHENLICFLEGATRDTLLRPSLQISNSVNTVFDVSKFNYWGSFVNGAHLISHSSILNAPLEIRYAAIDVLFLPSAVANSLPREVLSDIGSHVEKLIVGGESISDEVLRHLLPIGTDVYQIYGPSETTIWSTINRCKVMEQSGTLIGCPVSNEFIHLKRGTVSMEYSGQSAEIVLSGPKKFRGYYGDGNSSEHRSGDYAVLAGGKFRYLCRTDNQIKIKGQRVDTNEIENLIRREASVSNVAVIKDKECLLAYIVCVSEENLSGLREKLKISLRKASVPTKFIRVPRIPHTCSGKVHKRALLEMMPEEIVETPKVLNSLESAILHSARETLQNDKISVDSDFFDNGGHSLMAVQFSNVLSEKLKIAITAANIFENSKFSDLANSLKEVYIKQVTSSKTKTIITTLREVSKPSYNIFAIHAIGGTIYPYYSLLRIFPENVGIYGIDYKTCYPAETITALAHFYAQQIYLHSKDVPIFLFGHSMGGTLCREMMAEFQLLGMKKPFMVAIDTWCVEKGKLDLGDIEAFVTNTFEALPSSEQMIERSMKLAKMLKAHEYIKSDTKIHLIKAVNLGSSALRSAIRSDLTEEMVRSNLTNGLQVLSTNTVEVILAPGDHESVMKFENLNIVREKILELIKKDLQERHKL